MKKNLIFSLWVIMTLGTSLFAQQTSEKQAIAYLDLKGEVIFNIEVKDPSAINRLTSELSIVHYDPVSGTLKLMANELEFIQFLEKNIPFTVSEKDNIVGYRTMTSDLFMKAVTFPLTAYPTYADYESIMSDFATNYPEICTLENIGLTTEGDKSLLFIKLSDNPGLDEKEPRVMYTSSMHGDEIAGFPMMLDLIDFLLTTYRDTTHPRHAEIKELLDTNEIWINPLANPDGTYRNSTDNTSVANATRGNANNVDLNRNYADPDDGEHPDGNGYQVETQAFMDFASAKHFVLSANFHGGVELINYPWDTYAGAHPDEDYFIHISEEYRDFCQQDSPSGYFDDLNNGITNGYAWYEVQGGRQDYQIYYHKGREVTVELSSIKTPAANQLVNYWNYNKEALIAFLKQVNYGIRGVVTDAVTQEPIQAKIIVAGKENYETWTPTELPEGDYYRPIKGGVYTVVYEAECYEPLTITGVTIADYQSIVQDVSLIPIAGVAPTGLTAVSVQSTAATLSWDGDLDTSYDVRYRAVGDLDWMVVYAVTNFLDLINLEAEVDYEAQVRSTCASGAASPYSDSLFFTTIAVPACDGINVFPYSESFESGLGLWTNDLADDIDWTRMSGSTPSSGTGPTSALEGSFYLYTESSSNGVGYPGKMALLTSPCIDLTKTSGAVIEFNYHMLGSNMGRLEMLLSADDSDNYDLIWSEDGDQGDDWNLALVDLSLYAGSVIKIQFKGVTGTGFRSDMAIDNINIRSIVPDTEAPSVPLNVFASNITGATVDLSWNASTDDVGIIEYEIYQDENIVGTAIETSAIVTGLSSNTEYSFSVVAKDAAGNSSLFSNEVVVTTTDVVVTYCDSRGNNINDEYIDYVGLATISNATGANNGYADFTNLSSSVAFGENTIVLSLNYTGTVYTEYWTVWIDFDQNGIFDASEAIVSASTTSDANQAYSFTVPTSAQTGTTRMRVSLKYNAAATSCEEFNYGEVEDYTVNIEGVSARVDGEEMNVPDNFRVYPNPVTQGILFIAGAVDDNAFVSIYNYTGERVIQTVAGVGNEIDVHHLTKGLYILEIDDGVNKKVKRFVVN